MTRTVRTAALTHYFEVAHQLRLNSATLLNDAGLSRAMLCDRDCRIPAGTSIELLEASARAANCVTFGLRMAENRQISDFGPFGLLLTHQPTLRAVLHTIIKYRRWVNEALTLQIEEVGSNVIIREEVVTDRPMPLRQATELALGVLARTATSLLGSHWKPKRVFFTHGAPHDLELHRRIFKCDLQFNSDYNGFLCAAADLDQPCTAADLALAHHAEQLLQSLLSGRAETTRIEAVLNAIYLSLPNGRASVEQIAQNLAVNVRTLQRQLEEEGQTFSELINTARRELAIRYVLDGHHSLGRVAELLGYSTQTSFTRWFKSEFGISPTQWHRRERISASTQDAEKASSLAPRKSAAGRG